MNALTDSEYLCTKYSNSVSSVTSSARGLTQGSAGERGRERTAQTSEGREDVVHGAHTRHEHAQRCRAREA